jgi:predicted TIM-barrel fold metal-dependent hydrolase
LTSNTSRIVSRRQLLLRGAGVVLGIGVRRSVHGAVARAEVPVNFAVPRGATDCHVHVFGDPRQFPMFAGRTYTPETASVQQLRAMHRSLHIERTVVVTPSVYGTDNACTVDALRQLGSRARGIALIDDHFSGADLDKLDRAGVRGIRLNLEASGVPDPDIARERFQRALQQLAGRNWHIQMYIRLATVDALHDAVMASPIPVVLDHFARAQAQLGTKQPGFDGLLALVRSGKAYTKLSAAYRISSQGPDYADAAPLARMLVEANPRRILWGSDWPHPDSTPVPGRQPTDLWPPYEIDDGHLFNQLAAWVPEADIRKRILVDNPRGLYGF